APLSATRWKRRARWSVPTASTTSSRAAPTAWTSARACWSSCKKANGPCCSKASLPTAMTPEIALLLVQDGISTGAIYVLVGLGLVLIFLVTRVIFVPFGDVVGYSALTLAALQLKQMPGTVWLVLTLAAMATATEAHSLLREGQTRRLPRALIMYGVLPILPALLVWLVAGRELPMWLAIALTCAIILPISPLIYRVAFRPLADASVLVLLIVAVALHLAMSGLALVFFGPEGFRTEPLTRAFFNLGSVGVSGQSILIVASSAIIILL